MIFRSAVPLLCWAGNEGIRVIFGCCVLQLGAVLGLLVAGVFWVGSPILPQLVGGNADIDAAVHSILPLAIGMVPINAAVYVLDGILVGASDFKFLAGKLLSTYTTP